MVKSSLKYLYILLLLCIIFVVFYRYKQYVINRNYILEVTTICDPDLETCFSPSVDFGFSDKPYKKVTITANIADKCLEEHNCESFSCPLELNSSDICKIEYCSDENKLDGEKCINNI